MEKIGVEFSWNGRQWIGELSEVIGMGAPHWRLYVKGRGCGELWWSEDQDQFLFVTHPKGRIEEMADFLGKVILGTGWKPPKKIGNLKAL